MASTGGTWKGSRFMHKGTKTAQKAQAAKKAAAKKTTKKAAPAPAKGAKVTVQQVKGSKFSVKKTAGEIKTPITKQVKANTASAKALMQKATNNFKAAKKLVTAKATKTAKKRR